MKESHESRPVVGQVMESKPRIKELSLFSGYVGITLGLRLAGLQVRTIGYVEIEPYCQEIIKARIRDGHLDDAPIFSDIRSFDGYQYRGLADIVTAGFPCQPHSTAGRRRGAEDERNLWPDTLRVISEVGCPFVLLENVPGILANGYAGTVVGQLSEIGYDCIWDTVAARDVGATHRRDRWWCLGDTAGAGLSQYELQQAKVGGQEQEQESTRASQGTMGNAQRAGQSARLSRQKEAQLGGGSIPVWPPSPTERDRWASVLREHPELAPATPQPNVRGVANGRTYRVDRLRSLGNGVVPPVVAEFLRRQMKYLEATNGT